MVLIALKIKTELHQKDYKTNTVWSTLPSLSVLLPCVMHHAPSCQRASLTLCTAAMCNAPRSLVSEGLCSCCPPHLEHASMPSLHPPFPQLTPIHILEIRKIFSDFQYRLVFFTACSHRIIFLSLRSQSQFITIYSFYLFICV